MSLADVDGAAVRKAIAEHDEIGQTEFLRRHGFRPALRYQVLHDGRRYDSKAILGVAHQYATGAPLAAAQFSGGEATVVRRLEQLGFTIDDVDAKPDATTGPNRPAPESLDASRPPLVLIAPSTGNKAARSRFSDTLAQPVDYTDDRLRNALSDSERASLERLHPDGRARFWGALPRFNTTIDRLRQGDVVVFTGQNHVVAVAALGCKLRNRQLADLLWPPASGHEGWLNVYTLVGFQLVHGVGYPQLRDWVGSSDNDIFQATRGLSPEKSAAVITGLGLTIHPDEDTQDAQAEAQLLAALDSARTPASQLSAAENNQTTTSSYNQPARTITIHRAEAELVNLFRDTLPGHSGDHRLRTAVGHTDLYLLDDGDIIEAKRGADHRYVRQALGQLLDYAVNTDQPVHRLTALFPASPLSADIQLLHCYGIDCLYWNRDTTFTREPASDTTREIMRPLWTMVLNHPK
ncbi:hypothetical protein [Cryptosporangium arvum]|uniref:ScoMcrA-like N-terminal head domain-containing protein n=1 Tax=Cryptosporangium arvum DSM 44712 TaxID=927661 RepID=A0A011AJ33_9ACTN|nr:hypothetical protein [Cryptosporangium arvum]EXG82031.1 hypothetical protein CryarDRAFT_3163 [Cryptosporangium arvum DSM 44712]